MTDILNEIGIHIDCNRCDRSYEVSAATVALSQELIEQGCPGSSYECPATHFATLVDAQALQDLARAWRRVERSVSEQASQLLLRSVPDVESVIEISVGEYDKKTALQRWEDDGGPPPSSVLHS